MNFVRTSLALCCALLSLSVGQPLAAQTEAGDTANSRSDKPRESFVSQIGHFDQATVSQAEPGHFARTKQDGDSNQANVAQTGSGAHFAQVEQIGDLNQAVLAQSGSADQAAMLSQTGNSNLLTFDQQGVGEENVAFAAQLGNANAINLMQSGSDNRAVLVQEGSGNMMTANQLGNGNQLAWTQMGDNLSDLQISQSGNQAMTIIQSR